jgi:hypothetical protein
MRWVGGFGDWLALRDYTMEIDARAYEDVLIAMAGEADAARVSAAEAQAQRVHSSPHR